MKRSHSHVLAIFILTLFTSGALKAQQGGVGVPPSGASAWAQNAVYVELLGNGLVYSINYDRFISPNSSIRAGIGYIGLSASAPTDNGDGTVSNNNVSASLLTIPITFNYFLGSHDEKGRLSSSKFELGLGIIFIDAGESFGAISAAGVGVGGTATVGYRYQSYDGGFVFRVGFTPVFALSAFFPYGGIGAGFSF